MASEVKTIFMNQSGGAWDGEIYVTINNDASKGRAEVSATMKVFETDTGSPKRGVYRFFVYIKKNDQIVATGGSEGDQYDLYLTDKGTGGQQRYCSALITYETSCKITVGGWAICDSGTLGGTAVSGADSWNYEIYRPPTPIVTDKSTVQMKEKLAISLDRAYGTYTHKLFYKFGTGKETALDTGVGTSYAWTIPDMADLCDNSTSGICTLRAETYDGTDYIGQTTAEITITVPDATIPEIASGEVTLGTGSQIACQRNAANFTVKLQLDFHDLITTIVEGKIDTYEWKPAYDLAKQIPELTYGTGVITCITFNGSAEVGRNKTTIRVNVPENNITIPSFTLSGLKLKPISELGDEFKGKYLLGKTGLEAEIQASSEYSELKKYSITVGSLSADGNPARIPVLINEGDVKVTAKVTDARGYTTTVVTTIPVLPYRRPKVIPYTGYSNIICERALASGELNPQGTYLALKAGKSFSTIKIDGIEKNACWLRYRWKLSDADDFGNWITILDKGSAETEISLLISDVCTSLTSSYLVELAVEDSLGGHHSVSFVVMTEAVSFTLYDGDDGAGFGKYPELPHVVDIAKHMTLRVRGQIVVDNTNWEDLGFAEDVTESVYNYGRKEDSGCHYLVDSGSHVYVAFNCGFAYSGTAKIINGTRIAQNHRPLRPVMSLCPVNDRGIAMVSVDQEGYIRVEWVQKMTDTVQTGNAQVIWIDGYLDYWI